MQADDKIMQADDKFIQFGCWNNLNTKVKDGKEKQLGCLNKVFGLLNEYLTKVEVKPKFLIISGDNYYPEKQKEDDVTTNIVIHPDKLIEGFKKLEIDLPIYMMLGNHDLEKTPKEEDPTQQECKILELEMTNKPPNVEYNFFKYEMLNGTMVLMIDTSIYEDDSENYLQCYNKFFELSRQSFASIEEIKEYQLQQITEAITRKELKNIIIVGHHPIKYFKYKKPKEGKEAKIQFRSDIIHSFKPVLAHIYGVLGPKTNYYYLCSDMHLYQKGRIELQMGADVAMTIQQYSVGTGGTELDSPFPPDYAERVKTEDDITYTLEEEKAQCGFLECVVKEGGLEFTPIFVNLKGGNKKTKNKRSKRSKRTKKRSKRNKKTK